MAKLGLDAEKRKKILFQKGRKEGWVLCVGAGISRGAFPDWRGLTEKLAAKDCGANQAKALVDSLSLSYSYDALIQTAQHRLKMSAADFAKALSEELYGDLMKRLGNKWKRFAKALCDASPSDMPPEKWSLFLETVESEFPDVSALAIARVLRDVLNENDNGLYGIISFNAETLLYALVTAYVGRDGQVNGSGEVHRKRSLDRVTRAISNRFEHRIPYYYCHGILPVPGVNHRFNREAAVDKLVFSEAEYLHLSNSSFSWQSAVFLNACSLRSIVFVGVSLTDSNMRRWLSWVHENRANELRLLNQHADSTSHYWINREPSSSIEKQWIEASVAHLGVRLIWLKEWNELEACLRDMMSL